MQVFKKKQKKDSLTSLANLITWFFLKKNTMIVNKAKNMTIIKGKKNSNRAHLD
jgi:hypothetical protein